MKITTRISFGYGILITVLVALFVYQFITMQYMQTLNHTLKTINFESAMDCLEVMRDLDLVKEFTQKSFASPDPDYLKKLQENQKYFETSLVALRSHVNPGEESIQVNRLIRLWDSFESNLESLQKTMTPGSIAVP